MRLYHGTRPEWVASILERGLHPGRGCGGLVFLAEDSDMAAWWTTRGAGGPACVLEVDAQGLRAERHWSGLGSWCVHGTVAAWRLRALEPDPDACARGQALLDAADPEVDDFLATLVLPP